jgi:hypothetical protein
VAHGLVRHIIPIFMAKILWRTTHAPQNKVFHAPQMTLFLLVHGKLFLMFFYDKKMSYTNHHGPTYDVFLHGKTSLTFMMFAELGQSSPYLITRDFFSSWKMSQGCAMW